MRRSDRSDAERSVDRSHRSAPGGPLRIGGGSPMRDGHRDLDLWYERARRRWPAVCWPREAYARHIGDQAPEHPVDLYLGGAAGYRLPEAWEVIEQELGPATRRILARYPRADWTCEELWAETRVRMIDEQPDGPRLAGGRRAARILRYRGRVDLLQYLVTVGRRLAVERQRRRAQHLPLEAAGGSGDRSDPRTLPPDVQAGDREASRRIRAALRRSWADLEPEIQFLIVMVYFHGLRQKEAGALLGWSPFKTSRLINDALRELGAAARAAEAPEDQRPAPPAGAVARALCEQFVQLARGVPSLRPGEVSPSGFNLDSTLDSTRTRLAAGLAPPERGRRSRPRARSVSAGS